MPIRRRRLLLARLCLVGCLPDFICTLIADCATATSGPTKIQCSGSGHLASHQLICLPSGVSAGATSTSTCRHHQTLLCTFVCRAFYKNLTDVDLKE